MARPREFDIDEAIAKAMDVFWANGYQGSSLNDLLDAMQIARGSLYKAFKDKHSIYMAALDLYDRTVVQAAIDALHDKSIGDGLRRIKRMLLSVSEKVDVENDRRGCLVCNAAVDQAPFDDEVRAKVLGMSKRFEKAIAEALCDTEFGKTWSKEKREDMARQLNNSYMGLRVLTKAGYPASELAAIARTAMNALNAD